MTRLFSVLVIALSSLAAPGCAEAQADSPTSKFLAGKHVAKDGLNLPFRLYVPKNYDPKKSYPLVLALHGAGERGTDDSIQLTTHHLATLWAEDANQAKYPSFVLAPQCPPYPAVWVNTPFGAGTYNQDKVPMTSPLRAVTELLDSTLARYSIDTNRIYVAGLSMGGYATWDILMRYPKRFAAAIPICGGGDTAKAASIKHVPIWAFHGDSDKTVPVASTRQMIAALRKAGGTPRYTEYPGVDHGSWGPALREPDLADWLFEQKRAASTGLRGSVPARTARQNPSVLRTEQGHRVVLCLEGLGCAAGVDGLGRNAGARSSARLP